MHAMLQSEHFLRRWLQHCILMTECSTERPCTSCGYNNNTYADAQMCADTIWTCRGNPIWGAIGGVSRCCTATTRCRTTKQAEKYDNANRWQKSHTSSPARHCHRSPCVMLFFNWCLQGTQLQYQRARSHR
jgi:hypothetical protein